MKFLLFRAFLFLLPPLHALAHDGGENYLKVKVTPGGELAAEWRLPVSYVQDLFVEQPKTNEQLLASARKHREEIALLTSGDLSLTDGKNPCPIRLARQAEEIKSGKVFAVLGYSCKCESEPLVLGVRFKYLASDPHVIPLLISVESAAYTGTELGTNQVEETKIRLESSAPAGFAQFVSGGIHHIWRGVDHLLFLLTLLLPAVYVLGKEKSWLVRGDARSIVIDIVKTVSAFTLAHSITLCLVTFGLLTIPSRLVESVIALSVLLAGLNNLFPVVGEGRWKIAFLFGLVHGIAFAEVLTGLGLPLRTLLLALLGYNLGVEIGQLAIVLGFLPIAFALRNTLFYRKVLFTGGSVLAVIVAAGWLVERVAGTRFFFGG